MSENVFILGAGASAESGAPLMNNFLDIAEDLLLDNRFSHPESIKMVFEAINILQRVYTKSYLDLNNIEHVFGAIEMARIIERLEDYSAEKINDIRNSIVSLIVETLDKTIKYPVYDSFIAPSPSYKKFVDLLTDKSVQSCSILTFNYDIALDFAIQHSDHNVDYCLDENNSGRKLKLLKLHGSTNWIKERSTGKITPIPLKEFSQSQWRRSSKSVSILIFEKIKTLISKSPDVYENFPIIVPPTWNKAEHQSTLTNVWSAAAKELSEARNIYVFGYSLPESDLFFRYLFALGTIGDSRIRRFWVFDPDQSDVVKNRYQKLVGQGIRERFEYVPMIFSDAINELRSRINLEIPKYTIL